RGDFKYGFENWQRAAYHDRGADGDEENDERLLADDVPRRFAERAPINFNQLKAHGQQPHRDADEDAGFHKLESIADLQRDEDRDKAADEAHDDWYRLDIAQQNGRPEAVEDRRMQTVVASEQRGEHERRERVRKQQRAVDKRHGPRVHHLEDDLECGELD